MSGANHRNSSSLYSDNAGAKVVGINFSAQVTLEVREWPKGIPFVDETSGYDGKAERRRKLERYRFPRPFAISKLPTKDISMQSVANDDGEFRMYQGKKD